MESRPLLVVRDPDAHGVIRALAAEPGWKVNGYRDLWLARLDDGEVELEIAVAGGRDSSTIECHAEMAMTRGRMLKLCLYGFGPFVAAGVAFLLGAGWWTIAVFVLTPFLLKLLLFRAERRVDVEGRRDELARRVAESLGATPTLDRPAAFERVETLERDVAVAEAMFDEAEKMTRQTPDLASMRLAAYLGRIDADLDRRSDVFERQRQLEAITPPQPRPGPR